MTQLYARRQRQHAVSAPPRARVSTLSLSDLQQQWLLAAVIGLLLSCAAALAKAETIRPDDNASTISSVNFTAVSQAYYDKSKGPDCVVNRYTWDGQSFRDESYPMRSFDQRNDTLVGDKAFTALVSRSVRSIWKDYREGELYRVAQKIPEPIRNGGFDGNMRNWDYSLRLSDDDVKLKFGYEFD